MDTDIQLDTHLEKHVNEIERTIVSSEKLLRTVNLLHNSTAIYCCARCTLRFLNISNTHLYSKDDQYLESLLHHIIKKHGHTEVKSDSSFNRVCFSCLGLLQNQMIAIPENNNSDDASYGQMAFELLKSLKQCGYEYSDYSLAISLPPSIPIRQYSIWFYLKENAPESYTDDVPQVVEIKEVLKWMLGGLLQRELELGFKFQSDFTIHLTIKHPYTTNEHGFLITMRESEGGNTKARYKKRTNDDKSIEEISTNLAGKLLQNISHAKFKQYGTIPPPEVQAVCTFLVSFHHAPIYISGRYVKLSRELSQSPWIIDGQRKTENSVEEIIAANVVSYFNADGYKFLSAGREDMDVRMLGRGRPFVLELANPRKINFPDSFYREVEQKTNHSENPTSPMLRIVDLQRVSKTDVIKLKEGEQTKTKTYRCLVWISKAVSPQDLEFISQIKDLVVDQKTPVRVLHRRSLAVRKKTIHSASFEYIDNHFIYLDLETEAGTYIKEFIHSDLGRTNPSFTSLMGCQTDILTLDVMHVSLDFPPKVTEDANLPPAPTFTLPTDLIAE